MVTWLLQLDSFDMTESIEMAEVFVKRVWDGWGWWDFPKSLPCVPDRWRMDRESRRMLIVD